ncbi:hypothetical protein EDD17DRAFT_1680364 [Pisolithus thermaeus]|nr:hypothetical protein EDD17DRAFT_1680364 [Pisolithus thermaeus]
MLLHVSLSTKQPQKRIIFSGIQPTGIPHITISNWAKLQRTTEPANTLLFSILGWHALTLPQDLPHYVWLEMICWQRFWP